jgi:hypothetical protein
MNLGQKKYFLLKIIFLRKKIFKDQKFLEELRMPQELFLEVVSIWYDLGRKKGNKFGVWDRRGW